MINVKKQILYWETGADEEMLNAKIMIKNHRFLPGLFFCHLCLEKILKALVVKITEEHFDEVQDEFISEIQAFQLEGRYPENFPSEPDLVTTQVYFEQTINLHKWLKAKL